MASREHGGWRTGGWSGKSSAARGVTSRRTPRLEPLEDRRLLALTNMLPQYQDPQTGEFGGTWNPKAASKIDSTLMQVSLENRFRVFTGDGSDFRPSNSEVTLIGDNVVVDAFASADGNTLSDDIVRLGGQVTGATGKIVSALVPLSAMTQFADLASLSFATPAYRPVVNAGQVQSQGDAAMAADLARALGVDGSGIDVGIISDSFNRLGGYASDLANGEFPVPVTTVIELPPILGITPVDEGRALAQVIADVAPGAHSFFNTGVLGIGNFVAAINNLRNAGVDIIVDDLLYLSEPMFQDGAIAQAVSASTSNGVPHVSSAGNYSDVGADFGAFVDSGDVGINGGPLHDFDPGPGVDIYQKFTLPVGKSMRLSFQWDQPFLAGNGLPGAVSPGSASDVDILVVDKTGALAIAGSVATNVNRNPVEIFSFVNDGTMDYDADGVPDTEFNLAFELFFGPAPGRMKYVDFDAGMIIDEYDSSTSTSFGHYSAEGVFAVGAAPYTQTPAFGVDQIVLNEYSSLGRQEILFDVNGNRLPAPIVRHHPDATGPDQGDTTFFFPGVDIEPNGHPNFAGTSAAAPHVAAVMALMMDAAGGPGNLSVQSLYTGVKNTAQDILKRNVDAPEDIPGGLGYDYFSGHGLVDALAAVNGAMHGFNLVYDANDVAGDPALNDGDPAGDGVEDTFQISLAGDEVVITINGVEAGRMDFAAISTLTVNGSDDDDLLLVDFSGGNPIPAGGLEFSGGNSATTGDRVRFVGGAALQANHALNGPDAGTSEFDGSFISYTGVELVSDLTTPGSREIEMTLAAHFVTLTDGDVANNGIVRLFTSGTSPALEFANASVGTTLLLGDGDDDVTLETLDALATSPLAVFLGSGDDTATIVPQVSTPLSLDGGPQDDQDSLNVNALGVGVTDTGTELQFVGLQTATYADFENVSISDAGGGGGLPDISVESVAQAEGSSGITTDFVFTVTLSAANPNHSVFVDFFTSDGTAEDEFGDGDYFATSGTLEFAPGVTEQTVIVQVQQDTTTEPNEQFFLNLANAINANLLVAQTVGQIINDDFAGEEVVYVDDDWAGLPDGVDPDGAGPAASIGTDAFAHFPDALAAISPGGTVLMFAGVYQGAVVDKDVRIVGAEPNVVIDGAAEAIHIVAGAVTINGVTLDTSGDNATLLVDGGSLVLRSAVVRETDTGDQAAIRVVAGTADLGSTAETGLNRIRVRGDGLLIDNQTSSAISALGNTWVQGATTLDNFAIEDRVEHALDDVGRGLVTWVSNTLFVTAFNPAEITATRNNYRRLANLSAALSAGSTAYLRGEFDFNEAHALADWATGNNGLAGDEDDYHVVLPGGISDVTITAVALGDASIIGPGDLAAVDLEGVFQFGAGDTHDWEISRLTILDFDLSIDANTDPGNADARDGLLIAENHIRMSKDLNFAVAPADFFQNIAISLGPGRNQHVLGNRIDIPGDAVSAGGQFAASVGIQNQPAGPADYDGLLIEGNNLHVLSVAAAQPSTIVGIWDGSNGFESNITVRGNSFVNDSEDNDAAHNLQRAFRIGSQSGLNTQVLYENNTVQGANIGIHWQSGVNFSGNEPVEIRGNSMTDVFRGIIVASQGSANISGNTFSGLGASSGVGIDVQAGAIAAIDGDAFGDNEVQGFNKGIFVKGTAAITGNAATISGNEFGIDIDGGTATIVGNRIEGNVTGVRITDDGSATSITNNLISNNASDGIRITATAGSVGAIFNNSLSGNSNRSIRNQSGELIDASGNWWGANDAAGVHAETQGDIDFSPWLDTGADSDGNSDNGFQGDFSKLHVDDDSPQAASIGRIQEGISLTLAGGDLIIHDGEYQESNAAVDRPLTITGESREGVVIAPAATDDHTDSAFGGSFQHGFIIQSSDVTIESLTIDGEANEHLQAGRNNFRNGIVVDRRTGVVYDRTTIEDVNVLHIHRRGIEIYSSDAPGALRSLDNIIRTSRIEDVTLRDAILVREANTLIEDNIIVGAPTGIRASDNGDASNAPLIVVQGNHISLVNQGVSLTNASNGSLIGGAEGDGNVIDLAGLSSADVGVVAQYSQGQTAIVGNQIFAAGGDSAVWLFHNENASRPVIVTRNQLIATSSETHGDGQGVGIFVTDDGDLFGDEDGASYAEITKNTISGFTAGVHVLRSGDSPLGGREVVVTIGGDVPEDSNTLTDNGVGIRVSEVDGAQNGGHKAVAHILNNVLGITGGRRGIDIDGGAARIVGNAITDNQTGVRVQNSGVALLEGNDLRDNAEIGLLIRTAGIVDAGQVGAGVDYTGFGVSQGGNDFSSYTAAATATSGAIVNLNGDAVAGSQGAPPDVMARSNLFFSNDTNDIELVVYHDADDANLGFVNFVAPLPISVPGVAQVLVSSGDWTANFRDLLGASGYAVPGGPAQWGILPWVGMNTLQIVFTEDVVVSAEDLVVSGLNVPSYAIQSFHYNPATFTATWVLDTAIKVDLVTFTLSDDVVDVAEGLALDGEWANGASGFPSGDGDAGGDFAFGIRVLPGDVDRDGVVGLSDLNYVRNHFGDTTTDPLTDASGNGSIELGDLNAVRNFFGSLAPSIPPAPMMAAARNGALVDSVFSSNGVTRQRKSATEANDSIWDAAIDGLFE